MVRVWKVRDCILYVCMCMCIGAISWHIQHTLTYSLSLTHREMSLNTASNRQNKLSWAVCKKTDAERARKTELKMHRLWQTWYEISGSRVSDVVRTRVYLCASSRVYCCVSVGIVKHPNITPWIDSKRQTKRIALNAKEFACESGDTFEWMSERPKWAEKRQQQQQRWKRYKLAFCGVKFTRVSCECACNQWTLLSIHRKEIHTSTWDEKECDCKRQTERVSEWIS